MIEPRDSLGNRRNRWTSGDRRSFEHEYRDSKCARGGNLAIGRLTAAVLRNDRVNRKQLEQVPIVRLGEGATLENVSGVRHIQRRIDRIHAANKVVMLWSRAEWTQLLPPDSEKNPSRTLAQRPDGSLRIGNIYPDIAIDPTPGWPAHRQYWRPGSSSCCGGVRGNVCGVRMRSIDQKIDTLSQEILRKPISSPKSAATHGNGLSSRRRRTARKRDRRNQIASGQSARKLASLGRSSQD
jgi:hypothetical protein